MHSLLNFVQAFCFQLSTLHFFSVQEKRFTGRITVSWSKGGSSQACGVTKFTVELNIRSEKSCAAELWIDMISLIADCDIDDQNFCIADMAIDIISCFQVDKYIESLVDVF
jgi:hypothetical protein